MEFNALQDNEYLRFRESVISNNTNKYIDILSAFHHKRLVIRPVMEICVVGVRVEKTR